MQNVKKAFIGVQFALLLLLTGATSFGITGIVYQVTGWRMPGWLAWVLLGVAGVSAVIGLISTYGGVAIAPAIAKAIVAADSVSF